LKHCIEDHPFLSVVVKNKHTDKPAYEGFEHQPRGPCVHNSRERDQQ
jgi:hypothetical protein